MNMDGAVIEMPSRNDPAYIHYVELYERLHLVPLTRWSEEYREYLSFERFRRCPDFLQQTRICTDEQYKFTADYIEKNGGSAMFDELKEDHDFGVYTVEHNGRLLSRDLLDSMLEIMFLSRILDLPRDAEIRALDIGAGYGRFAHRFTTWFPRSRIACVDGVPESTYLCRCYLKHRRCTRASVVSLDELCSLEALMPFTFAASIHSWPECSLESIKIWLQLIANLKIPYLFLVTHTRLHGSFEPDGRAVDYFPAIADVGYSVIKEQPKFGRIGQGGLFPEVHYYLFSGSWSKTPDSMPGRDRIEFRAAADI